MMELWELFSTFFIIGFVSFGGGYAMIPVIESEVSQHGWMTTQQFADVIAISGMSPGPVTANSAILVGYSTAGFAGAISSVVGILLPAIIFVTVIATFFSKMNQYSVIQSMFYGLRPIVTSLILFAAISFALSNQMIALNFSWHTISLLLVFGLSLFALMKLRWHPAYVIILSGLVGVVLYS